VTNDVREAIAWMGPVVVGIALWGGLASGDLMVAIRAVRLALGI
jgi:hypothetical protein